MAATPRLSHLGRRLAAAHGARPSRRGAAVAAGLALVGLGAAWAIFATAREQDQPTALGLAASGQALLDGGDAAQRTAARTLALRSLARAPINPPALRVLAEEAVFADDRPRGMALFALAQRWSRRDAITDAYMLDDALKRSDAAAAVRQGDIVLRTQPQAAGAAFPVLKTMAERRANQPIVVSALATRPQWRGAFITYLAKATGDPAVVLDVLSHLADARSGPDDGEVQALLDRMVADGRYVDAFVTWRQFQRVNSPLLTGNVRDAAFEGRGGGAPFGWVLQPSPGADVDIVQGPVGAATGDHALRVGYDGVSAATPARQMLVLEPGDYRLNVQAYVASPLTTARLAWTLSCAGSTQALGATRDGPLAPGWNTLSANFTVPETGCDGQWLTLGATPGEQPADIDVWYGQLQIRRAAAGV